MNRRMLIAAASFVLTGLPALLSPASAQTKWPDKPVKVIVPYAAGGATDAIARPWSEELSKAFGQQFVIENRGGASGMIGMVRRMPYRRQAWSQTWPRRWSCATSC